MKRHPSIVSLSREHHGALILAKLLRKNSPGYKHLPTNAAGKAEYATDQYHNELSQHFLAEEVSLLEQVVGVNNSIDLLIKEIYAEHKKLRKLFETIPKAKNLEDYLDQLGRALEDHIRKEERVLFPLIQEKCDAQLLNRIQGLLEKPVHGGH